MPYATQQDMVERFGEEELIQLTDRDRLNEINTGVLDRAFKDADADIDAALAGRYALPLAVVPLALNRIACDLARYYLYKDEAPEHVIKRYDDAVKFLRAVSKGENSLGVDDAGAGAQPSEGAQMESGGLVFDRKKSDGFI